MGGIVFKMISKKGKDSLSNQQFGSVFDIPARLLLDAPGSPEQQLRAYCEGKKAVLFVNVATK